MVGCVGKGFECISVAAYLQAMLDYSQPKNRMKCPLGFLPNRTSARPPVSTPITTTIHCGHFWLVGKPPPPDLAACRSLWRSGARQNQWQSDGGIAPDLGLRDQEVT